MEMQIKMINGAPHMRIADGLWRPVPADEAPRFEVLHTLERTVKTDAAFRTSGAEVAPMLVDVRKIRTPTAMVGGRVASSRRGKGY